MSSEEGKERYRQICLEKYGVDNVIKTKDTQEKIYQTKKKNGTFNTSALEVQFHETLIKIFGADDVFDQYRDQRYANPKNGRPYMTDFYIKSLDLFIEIQGRKGHGEHPNCNRPEDRTLIKELILKNNEYDKRMSDCYISDTIKRSVAKKNRLHYIEVFRRVPKEYTEENIRSLIDSHFNQGISIWGRHGDFYSYEPDTLWETDYKKMDDYHRRLISEASKINK